MAIGDTFSGLAEDAKRIPWWGWVAGAGAGFLIWQHFQGSASASTPPSSTPDTSAATLDTSGGGTVNLGVAPGPSGGVKPPMDLHKCPAGFIWDGSKCVRQQTGGGSSGGGTSGGTSGGAQSYTVASGDSLSSIASHHGVDEQALYSANQGIIESTAKAHGFSSSDNGHWIFPGEQLVIP